MRNILFCTAIIVAVVTGGCGKKIVVVTGEVFYEGSPAKDVAVLFEPKSDSTLVSESGIAVTDSEGRFTLESSSRKRGIEPGNYTVHVGWRNPTVADVGDAGPSPGGEAQTAKQPYLFPEEKSVVVEVKGTGKNHLVCNITPEEVRWE